MMPASPVNSGLHLTILNREQVLFDGDVVSVTSVNDTGEFDILALHENFISLVRNKISYVLPKAEMKTMTITRGIMQVASNQVRVFL